MIRPQRHFGSPFCSAATRRSVADFDSAAGDSTHNAAFTLVELLVAMTIFVLLATITISAWRGTDADRVSNAAATFKNALEGAKSRAVKSNATRGLRLNLDPNNNRIVTSVIYVESGKSETGNCYLEYDNRIPADPNYSSVSAGKWRLTPDDTTLWATLKNRGLITSGTKVKITASTATSDWMQLDRVAPDDSNAWLLLGAFSASTTVPTTPSIYPEDTRGGERPTLQNLNETNSSLANVGIQSAVISAAMPYQLFLEPSLLAGAEPISLPANTCIDLDGSKIPRSWQRTASKAFYGPQTGYMDILFSSRGSVDRPLTTDGILHFRAASISDLLLSQGLSSTSLPSTQSLPIVITDPEHGAKLISIITQTGVVLNADVYPSVDVNAGFNNDAYNFNDSAFTSSSIVAPYYYVLYGKESK